MNIHRSPKYHDIASWYELQQEYDHAKKQYNHPKVEEVAKKILKSNYYKDIRKKYGLD